MEGTTIRELGTTCKGRFSEAEIRKLCEELEQRGLIVMSNEAHNRFRYWDSNSVPVTPPGETENWKN